MKTTYLAALTLACLASTNSHAAADMAGTQAPGYYRMMLGNFEVTVLNDGTMDLPVDQLLNQDPKTTLTQLKQVHASSPLETSDNAFLINTGKKLVLIDAGAGANVPTLGGMLKNLAAAGYSPEQVDEIYITHMHPDHVGGLIKDGKAVFPNAIIRADKAEVGYWLSESEMAKAPEAKQGYFKAAMAALAPYQAAGKIKPFSGETALMDGISAEPAHGHTPGHSTYKVTSEGQTLMVLGDLMHVAAVQFAHPDVTIKFDSDNVAAEAQRQTIFKQIAESGVIMSATHLQFPALGYLNADGNGYRWVPVNYQRMR